MKPIKLRFHILFIFLTLLTAHAEAQKTFNVGDRVLVSPSGLKDEKYWKPGTVTEVHNFIPKKAYSVSVDNSSSVLVNEDWIKELPAQDNNVQKNAPEPNATHNQSNKRVEQNQNNKVTCPPSDDDSKGKTAMEKNIRGAIRTGFERTPQPNSDGRITVAFQNVSIGTSHTGRDYLDPEEAKGKNIYQVRADFTTCTDYNRRIVVVKMERVFACYKNIRGEWTCDVIAAANTNIKDQTKSIDKKNP